MRLRGAADLETRLFCTYLFISPSDWEKEQWVQLVASAYRTKGAEIQLIRFSGVDEVQKEIDAFDLFGRLRLCIVDEVDKVKGVQLTGNSTAIVILLASSFKTVSHLEKEGVAVLDVSGEKPWDRERRVQEWVRAEVRKMGKEIASDAVSTLIVLVGFDFAALHQEIKKLALYTSQNLIESRDVEAICGARDLFTGWQLSETAIWQGPVVLGEKGRDVGFMMPFIGQLRYQLQLGAKTAELIQHKQDLEKHLPSVRTQQLKKIAPLARERGLAFFLAGLSLLYELEFAAKSSSLDLSVLFDIFQAKLYEKTHSST